MLYHTSLLDFPTQTPCQDSKRLYLCGPKVQRHLGYSGKSPSTAALLISLMSSSPAKGSLGISGISQTHAKKLWKCTLFTSHRCPASVRAASYNDILKSHYAESCSVIVQLFIHWYLATVVKILNLSLMISVYYVDMWTPPDTFSCSRSIFANSSNKYMLSLSNFIPRWYCSSTMRFTSQFKD